MRTVKRSISSFGKIEGPFYTYTGKLYIPAMPRLTSPQEVAKKKQNKTAQTSVINTQTAGDNVRDWKLVSKIIYVI